MRFDARIEIEAERRRWSARSGCIEAVAASAIGRQRLGANAADNPPTVLNGTEIETRLPVSSLSVTDRFKKIGGDDVWIRTAGYHTVYLLDRVAY